MRLTTRCAELERENKEIKIVNAEKFDRTNSLEAKNITLNADNN